MGRRLIDADALIKRFKALMGKEIKLLMLITDVIKIIKEQPTIEAEPVVHGEWIPHDRRTRSPLVKNYACSNCGVDGHRTNYCPNCGAKMDGGDQRE